MQTRNRHLRNRRGLSMQFPTDFQWHLPTECNFLRLRSPRSHMPVAFSNWMASVMLQRNFPFQSVCSKRIDTFPVDLNWNCPMDFQWAAPILGVPRLSIYLSIYLYLSLLLSLSLYIYIYLFICIHMYVYIYIYIYTYYIYTYESRGHAPGRAAGAARREAGGRQEGDGKETGGRQEGDRRETGGREEGDGRETGGREAPPSRLYLASRLGI